MDCVTILTEEFVQVINVSLITSIFINPETPREFSFTNTSHNIKLNKWIFLIELDFGNEKRC